MDAPGAAGARRVRMGLKDLCRGISRGSRPRRLYSCGMEAAGRF